MIAQPAGYVTRMRIHHLNCATMCPPARPLVNGDGSLLEAGRVVCHCLLVEAGDRLILVDTGLGTADLQAPAARLGGIFTALLRPAFDPAEAAVAQVRALGFDPTDVRDVVVTHLDVDHAGGLADFPHAAVHLDAAEHHAAMNPTTPHDHQRYRRAHWAHGPRWAPHPPGGEAWMGFEGVRELIAGQPDVLLVPLVGHTRGHAGVAVRGPDGWLLHAGDAFYHRDELADPPRCPPAMAAFQALGQVDAAQRLANQARLRALAKAGEVRIVCSHDPVQLDACRAREAR